MTEIITRTESSTECIHSQGDFKGCDFVTLIVPTDFTRRRFYHLHCSNHYFIHAAGSFLPTQQRKINLYKGYEKNYRWMTLKNFGIGFGIHRAQTSGTHISHSRWHFRCLSQDSARKSPQLRLSLSRVMHFRRLNSQQWCGFECLADFRFA